MTRGALQRIPGAGLVTPVGLHKGFAKARFKVSLIPEADQDPAFCGLILSCQHHRGCSDARMMAGRPVEQGAFHPRPGAPVIFVVWNNSGYREIETSMRAVGVEPVGVSPAPPDFCKLADAYGIAAERLMAIAGLPDALRRGQATAKPYLIEIIVE